MTDRRPGVMATCNGCGGVIGRDCFNPVECEQIALSIDRDYARSAMEEYAAQEVEHKTKQLQEERDVLFEFLKRCFPNNEPSYYALLATARDAINFINQLNQKNEK